MPSLQDTFNEIAGSFPRKASTSWLGLFLNFNAGRLGNVCPTKDQSRSPILQENAEARNSIPSKKQDKASICRRLCSSYYEPETMKVFASCKISLPSNLDRGSVRRNTRSSESVSHDKAQALPRSTERLFEGSNRLGNNICNWALGPGISSSNTRMMEYLNATECLSLSCVMHQAYSCFL